MRDNADYDKCVTEARRYLEVCVADNETPPDPAVFERCLRELADYAYRLQQLAGIDR